MLSTYLAKYISDLTPRYSYRFLFLPGGIGSIVWLCLNEDKVANIRHGLVFACIGDSGKFTYKKSRRGDTEIDQAVVNVLKNSGQDYDVVDFSPYGYDERNFCSTGFDLPVGSLTRSTHEQYAQYHCSADDLDFVKRESLANSYQVSLSIINTLENNKKYINLSPKGEIQLGKRGLYGMMGGLQKRPAGELPLLWVSNLSDGKSSLLDISDKSKLSFDSIKTAADILEEHGLLKAIS